MEPVCLHSLSFDVNLFSKVELERELESSRGKKRALGNKSLDLNLSFSIIKLWSELSINDVTLSFKIWL